MPVTPSIPACIRKFFRETLTIKVFFKWITEPENIVSIYAVAYAKVLLKKSPRNT